jgi:hypothetical protein
MRPVSTSAPQLPIGTTGTAHHLRLPIPPSSSAAAAAIVIRGAPSARPESKVVPPHLPFHHRSSNRPPRRPPWEPRIDSKDIRNYRSLCIRMHTLPLVLEYLGLLRASNQPAHALRINLHVSFATIIKDLASGFNEVMKESEMRLMDAMIKVRETELARTTSLVDTFGDSLFEVLASSMQLGSGDDDGGAESAHAPILSKDMILTKLRQHVHSTLMQVRQVALNSCRKRNTSLRRKIGEIKNRLKRIEQPASFGPMVPALPMSQHVNLHPIVIHNQPPVQVEPSLVPQRDNEAHAEIQTLKESIKQIQAQYQEVLKLLKTSNISNPNAMMSSIPSTPSISESKQDVPSASSSSEDNRHPKEPHGTDVYDLHRRRRCARANHQNQNLQ